MFLCHFGVKRVAPSWGSIQVVDYWCPGCEITGFLGHPKTLPESELFHFDFRPESLWKSRSMYPIDSPFPFRNPERFSESQYLGVAFQMETPKNSVILHPTGVLGTHLHGMWPCVRIAWRLNSWAQCDSYVFMLCMCLLCLINWYDWKNFHWWIWQNLTKMQLDVDIEPTFRFTYMRTYTDKQKDPIL